MENTLISTEKLKSKDPTQQSSDVAVVVILDGAGLQQVLPVGEGQAMRWVGGQSPKAPPGHARQLQTAQHVRQRGAEAHFLDPVWRKGEQRQGAQEAQARGYGRDPVEKPEGAAAVFEQVPQNRGARVGQKQHRLDAVDVLLGVALRQLEDHRVHRVARGKGRRHSDLRDLQTARSLRSRSGPGHSISHAPNPLANSGTIIFLENSSQTLFPSWFASGLHLCPLVASAC